MKSLYRVFALVAVIAMLVTPLMSASAQYVPTANGCGPENGPSVPNYWTFYNLFGKTDVFPFVNACNPHDICYGTLGSNRATCDTQFLNNLLNICSTYSTSWASRTYCQGLAYTYYYAVAWFGQPAFDAAQARARQG